MQVHLYQPIELPLKLFANGPNSRRRCYSLHEIAFQTSLHAFNMTKMVTRPVCRSHQNCLFLSRSVLRHAFGNGSNKAGRQGGHVCLRRTTSCDSGSTYTHTFIVSSRNIFSQHGSRKQGELPPYRSHCCVVDVSRHEASFGSLALR